MRRETPCFRSWKKERKQPDGGCERTRIRWRRGSGGIGGEGHMAHLGREVSMLVLYAVFFCVDNGCS